MQNERNKKNIVQDVVPARRSIRNVELPSRRMARSEDTIVPEEIKVKPKKISPKPEIKQEVKLEPKSEKTSYKFEYDEPKKSGKKWLYVSICVFVLALAFGISAFFKGAKITVTPKHQTTDLNATFTAKKDDTGGGLAFQIVTASKDVEKTVPATGQSQVEKKAVGKIIVTNNYSATAQKLVATTRFQTSSGLIFRAISPVTIPGKQVVNGKTVPGSAEVAVAADASGDKYNIAPSNFTIPGFKGDPRYTSITAKSETPMTGGFSGIQKTVAGDVLTSTNTELESSLKTALETDIASQIPANFVMYSSGLSYVFSPVEQASSNDSSAVLRKKGTAYAIIFDKGSLSRAVVSKLLPDTANDLVKTTNLEKLTFAYPAEETFDPSGSAKTLDFSLSGQANLVWVFDENKLKSDLLGLSKKQAKEVLAGYGAITEVWLSTSPFWNQTIPTNSTKVTLVNTLAN